MKHFRAKRCDGKSKYFKELFAAMDFVRETPEWRCALIEPVEYAPICTLGAKCGAHKRIYGDGDK